MWVAAALRTARLALLRSWNYALVITIALASVCLKAFQWYHSRPLWLDEEMIFLNIRDRTLSQLAGPLWLDQTAPLGWLALQRAVLLQFGTNDRAVRALSVLFGMGIVACAVWVAVRWMKPAGAAVFLVLCSFSQWMTFYALEAKPYATDAFWALLLPALAVWVLDGEPGASKVNLRRSLIWWISAAIGQWISYGAMFVAPACAGLMLTAAWLRGGPRRAYLVALQGIPWLVSFAAHYYLVVRHARASTFLVDYWAPGMPPKDAGLGAIIWLAEQAEPLASHPGGTTAWLVFWGLVVYGIFTSLRNQPTFGIVWLLVILSAGLFATLRLVPMSDRLALWILPASYAAIALGADDALRRLRDAKVERSAFALAQAGIVALLFLVLGTDMAQRTRDNLFVWPTDNHGLNDHAALRFLMVQRQPGDVLVSTHFGLPAVWWYAGISIADGNAGRRYSGDNSPVLELMHEAPQSRTCRMIEGQTDLRRTLGNARRAAVHLGFDSNSPPGFQQLILDEFSEFSSLVSLKFIANEDAVAIFDLTSRPEPTAMAAAQGLWRRPGAVLKPHGCVGARPARRW
jgi:hypothetical protein